MRGSFGRTLALAFLGCLFVATPALPAANGKKSGIFVTNVGVQLH